MHNEEYFYIHGKDVYSVQSLLVSLKVKQEDSIYKDSANDFVRWPFSAVNLFTNVPEGSCEPEKNNQTIQGEVADDLEKINAEIKSCSDSKYDFEKQEKLRELRARKKELMKKAAESVESGRKSSLVYKSVVEINDSKMVEKKFPQFAKTKWPYREQMPYFTAALEDFVAAVNRGEPTAIFGGPCFFGEYEVDMIFSMKDGSEKIYDFTTRRRNSQDKVSLEAEFTKKNADEVADVSFKSHKTSLTTDEFDSILYLFELAKATGSAVTIPIPDFSYAKYLSAMLASLSTEIQERAVQRFEQISKPIIAMYKELFEFFKKKYPEVKCALMSGEETELLNLYYEKRRPFVDKNSTQRIISGIKEKIESVKDYITLPALPFYLWGVKNVLEVDYLGETDSYWKCRKMHKGQMKLSALLYPIKISADGWRTLFSTELKYKEYINKEDYDNR